MIKKMEIEEAAKQRAHEIEVLRLRNDESARDRAVNANKSIYDLGNNLTFMPKFDETDVENFFILFERTADHLKWPKEHWCFLTQTAFVGKAKLIYSNLPSDNVEYDHLKMSILDAYDQVPETHRQNFRNLKKGEKQTYLKFVKEKERFFKAWLRASKVANFEQLCQLVLLEEILRKVAYALKLYLTEREVNDVNKVATLAEIYRLTNGDFF